VLAAISFWRIRRCDSSFARWRGASRILVNEAVHMEQQFPAL
jgi:hypothetical protein